MKIGKFFTLEELTVTGVKLPNKPNLMQQQALSELVAHVLDPLRAIYGSPIHITSAFRSEAVNKAIGGASTSQHCKGEAADIDCGSSNALIFRLIRDNFRFDQLIWERGDLQNPSWVHVSFRADGENRNQILRFDGKKYLPFK